MSRIGKKPVTVPAGVKIGVKDRTIHVEGRLQTRSWEDSSGTKRYMTEVNAQSILLLGGGRGRGADASGSTVDGDHGGSLAAEHASAVGEDDVPF